MDTTNTMADQMAETDATLTNENQAVSAKTFTQDEVNAILAKTKGQLERKFASRYEELGDIDELRQLKKEAEHRRQQEQLKRGEFEKTLQELAGKKDAEIQKRDMIIKEYKVNTPLLSAAARYRAVNAEQVRQLLGSNLRLNDLGEVEVIDNKGTVRYNDQGEPLQVDDLVKEFLDTNPHFVAAAPSTTMGKSNISQAESGEIDFSKLDFKLADHRKLYAAEMAKKKK